MVNIKQLTGVFVGGFIAFLGLLWFLQGIGLMQMCPVVCITNCECITGGSPLWAVAGAIVFIVGIVIAVRLGKI